MTLRAALESMSSLVAYERSYCDDDNSNVDLDEYNNSYESEGILFFRTRIHHLLETMVDLQVEHFVSTMLHPRYRHLNTCSSTEIKRCKKYIQTETRIIAQTIRNSLSTPSNDPCDPKPPPAKKQKRFGEQFESGNMSDEYDSHEEEELDRYLAMRLDVGKIHDDPMVFWKSNSKTFPILSILARRMHSVPATTASVERAFSGGGNVLNERRTSLSPSQLDNVLFLRSVLSKTDLL